MEENTPQQSKMPQYPPQNYRREPRRSRWWIPVLVIGIVIVGFFVVFGLIVSQFGSAFEKKEVDVTDNSVLYLTLDNDLPEYVKTNPFMAFSGGSSGSSFFETLRAIKAAKTDNRIKGIYIKPSPSSSVGLAKASELYDALMDFKASGKFIYAFMEVGAENQYYSIAPADSIFMPTEGIAEINGYSIASLFFKDFFEKIGIDYTVIHFEDFKSAGEMFNRTSFSDSARVQLKILLDQRLNYFVDAVSKNRKMTKEQVLSILNRGVYMADSLKNLGWVDVLASEHSVKEFLKYKVNGDNYKFPLSINNNMNKELLDTKYDKKLKLVKPEDFLASVKNEKDEIYDEKTQIAIINGVGAISSGSGSSNGYEIKSTDFIKDLKKARNNEKVKAIILRIDSPGGSVIASDEIWEEIIKTKSIKPVYASMSNVAASGGYYMAMACDTIIAHPATITGSIGVVMAIPNLSGTMGKLGITADTLSTGPAAQFLNGFYPFRKDNLDQLFNMSQGIYFRFVNRVADSRKKSFDEIRAVAKGRVWTGEDAKVHGLVDVLGGIQTSIDMAKKRLGIPVDKKVVVKFYPEPEDEFEAILKLFNLSQKDEDEDDVKSNNNLNIAKAIGLDKKSILSNFSLLPKSFINQINYMIEMTELAGKEKQMYAMPYLIEIK